MLAVIESGGKQHLVREGQILKVEKIDQKEGVELTFDVLLTSDEEGKTVQVGAPYVSGAKVTATIAQHGRGDKVSVIKYKPKVRYRRNVGHRQPYTQIKIEKIAA